MRNAESRSGIRIPNSALRIRGVRVKRCGARALNVRAHQRRGDSPARQTPPEARPSRGQERPAPLRPPGVLLDRAGNCTTREMIVAAQAGQNPAYTPADRWAPGFFHCGMRSSECGMKARHAARQRGLDMWASKRIPLPEHQGMQFMIQHDAQSLSFQDVFLGWQNDEAFRQFFNALLADSSFDAFRWEVPCVRSSTLTQPFECVLLDSPGLIGRLDASSFARQFQNANDNVVAFQNLGGDATLIVPCPIADTSAYGHLASFVRAAPATQQSLLWTMVGSAMLNRIGDKPLWLSTAGFGVSWLHVRLDIRPKYYGFDPYKNPNWAS